MITKAEVEMALRESRVIGGSGLHDYLWDRRHEIEGQHFVCLSVREIVEEFHTPRGVVMKWLEILLDEGTLADTGARVRRVPVYRFERLPSDDGQL